MIIRSKYEDVRHLMREGDIIAFSGQGFISRSIQLFQRCPVSHVGVIYEAVGTGVSRRIDLMESTTLDGLSGVQQTRFSERLAAYNGPVWWLPLSVESRARLDPIRLWQTLRCSAGKKYDFWQCAHHAIDWLHLWAQKEDSSKLFCSELVALALKRGGVLPTWVVPNEIRPVDLIELRIYQPNYHQIKGKTLLLDGYNAKTP